MWFFILGGAFVCSALGFFTGYVYGYTNGHDDMLDVMRTERRKITSTFYHEND